MGWALHVCVVWLLGYPALMSSFLHVSGVFECERATGARSVPGVQAHACAIALYCI